MKNDITLSEDFDDEDTPGHGGDPGQLHLGTKEERG
jgi:hypothetical protein